MLVGLVQKERGKIELKGNDIEDDYSKITSITGYMPERFSLYTDLSVEENMNFFADIHQVPRKLREERKNQFMEKMGMSAFKNRRAGALSGGMKQKLALSTILLAAPEIIILDEPATGVDPLSRIEFFNIISELKEEGKTILISTPYLDEAEQGDYIIFLKNGRIIKEGSISDLRSKFPAKILRILPRGNVFDVVNELKKAPDSGRNLLIKGNHIKYLQKEGEQDYLARIPYHSVEEQVPTLEDIYIYYERGAST
jgi:ABC-2 type transport system ATP-binding protein